MINHTHEEAEAAFDLMEIREREIIHAGNLKKFSSTDDQRLLGKGNGIYRNALPRRTERKKDAKKAHVKTHARLRPFKRPNFV